MVPVSGDEIMHFSLNKTVMKSLLIYPSQWNEHICIRIELYGCVPGMFAVRLHGFHQRRGFTFSSRRVRNQNLTSLILLTTSSLTIQ